MDANQEKGFALPKGPPIGWTRVATATELRETEQKFLRSYSRVSRASLVSSFGIRPSAVALAKADHSSVSVISAVK